MAMRVPSTGISQEVSLGSVPFNPAVDRNFVAGNGVLFAAPRGMYGWLFLLFAIGPGSTG
jgi:hypothetical protein